MVSAAPVLLHRFREFFVLVGGDEIHAGANRCPPSNEHGTPGTEVVAGVPTAILRACEAIQRVKADPVAQFMSAVHQRSQTAAFGGGPLPRLGLPAFLYLPPRVVPPATV